MDYQTFDYTWNDFYVSSKEGKQSFEVTLPVLEGWDFYPISHTQNNTPFYKKVDEKTGLTLGMFLWTEEGYNPGIGGSDQTPIDELEFEVYLYTELDVEMWNDYRTYPNYWETVLHPSCDSGMGVCPLGDKMFSVEDVLSTDLEEVIQQHLSSYEDYKQKQIKKLEKQIQQLQTT